MQTIGTHSGNFHPDDVLAVATIKLYLQGEEISLVRTRNKAKLADLDWVVDVGGVYDPNNQRFDHHQPNSPLRTDGTPYSAFGLVWKHLGHAVCTNPTVVDMIDKQLVLPIDAADNAIAIFKLKNEHIVPFQLYDVIDSYKPSWGNEERYCSAFLEAVDFAVGLITRLIQKYEVDIEKQEYISQVHAQSADKTILVFEEIVKRDDVVGLDGTMMFISPASSVDSDCWVASSVPTNMIDFESKSLFPEAWAGRNDSDLESVSGIAGAVFCNKDRFMFVGKTKESALRAAHKALE
jgi:uncharacterized UPF0160 family protein